MDENIRTALADNVLEDLESLRGMAPGSEDRKSATEDLAKLYRLGLEEEKNDTEWDEKLARREIDRIRLETEKARLEMEKETQNKQIIENRIFRCVDIGLKVAGFLIAIKMKDKWLGNALRFEETGTFTAKSGRWIQDMTRLFEWKK